MAHAHHPPHTKPAAPALAAWAGLLLSSGLYRVLGAAAVCGPMWLALWWAMQ